ncbi:MAG: hypothetical protein VZR27_14360 [Acutalibacteraceae bacterium]|nr:hypothetical protein [Acutalibacteraceae bacterium]
MQNKTTFELPCDFGDSIYEACKICSKVHERKVTGFKIGIGGNLILTDTKNFIFREIGTDVFFNKEDAEKVLKGT